MKPVRVFACVIGLAAVVAAGAGAVSLGGGKDITSAPTIGLNTVIQGHLFDGAFDGEPGEYFKVNFMSGDRLTIQTQSTGDEAPCPDLFPPGTNDFNFDRHNGLNSKTWNVNGSRNQVAYIIGTTGTYILAMNALFDDCYERPAQWDYTFTLNAPHLLRLSFVTPSSTFVAGTSAIVKIRVTDALSKPVSGLPLSLLTKPVGVPLIYLGKATAVGGVATFHFTVPRRLSGKKITISAYGGDNRSWVKVRVGRGFRVR